MAITCAAVDDVTAWCLLALIIAIAKAGCAVGATCIVGLTLIDISAMLWLVKPLLGRLIGNSEIDQRLMAIVLMLVLVSA